MSNDGGDNQTRVCYRSDTSLENLSMHDDDDERGDYVSALEQIRSAPIANMTWRERYAQCVRIASETLDKHADKRLG